MSDLGNIKVTLDLGPLDRFEAAVRDGLSQSSGAFRPMKIAWGTRYSTFVRRRFNDYSRGAGDWPPLALSTLRRKALKGVKKAKGMLRKGSLRSQGEGKAEVSSLARDTARGGQLVGFSGRSSSILVDTGVLRNALQIGTMGNQFNLVAGGIEFGFSEAAHPTDSKTSKAATIAKIAGWHNAGAPPRLPRRSILAQPDQQTIRGMQQDLDRAIAATMQAAGGTSA